MVFQPELTRYLHTRSVDFGKSIFIKRRSEQYQAQLVSLCAQGNHDPETEYGPCGIIVSLYLISFLKRID
ncbi:hypothetical protein C8J55DRAFT_524531 [Lentinula edodes]|uniref:Uncharacterized protein n=1 Tax=Lentinula lateritia TaxID=40482 RepID=A0A9W9DGX3_9AGAR|nr:hypothetical protein C8J55DRAFT_524531 [Lentinula edodes]